MMRRLLALVALIVSLSGPLTGAQEPAADAKAFPALFTSWNDMLKQLETYQLQYKGAKPEERPAIREQFDRLLKEGEAMQPKLRAAAEAAYQAEPNQSQDVVDILVSFLYNDMQRQRYDSMLAGAKLLVDGKYDNARIYSMAGLAAYQLGQYDDALSYLGEADAKNALSVEAQPLLRDLRANWPKEKDLRAAEAKADDLPRIELETSKGRIVLELFENQAPNTVANFISLVEKKFYDGLSFHRVLEDFVAQGGDPKGDGTGGPGHRIACECYTPEHRLHFLGALSMAHAGRDSGGSQFFITFRRTENLDGKHTVFGRVIEGLDVLPKLQRRDPTSPNPPEPDKIVSAKVLRKRDHAYEPKTTPDKS